MIRSLVALAALAALTPAAATQPPRWLAASGFAQDGQSRLFVGVGVVGGDVRRRELAMALAGVRACADASLRLAEYVGALSKGFAADAQLPADTQVSRFSKYTLKEPRITATWRDPVDGSEFARCEVPLAEVEASVVSSEGIDKNVRDYIAKHSTELFDRLAEQRPAALAPALSGWSRHTDPVTALAFSRDGRRLATADGRAVAVWSVPDGRLAWAVPGIGEVLSFAGDGSLAAIGWHGAAQAWDAAGAPRPSGTLVYSAVLQKDYASDDHTRQDVTRTIKLLGKNDVPAFGVFAECLGKSYLESSSDESASKSSEAEQDSVACRFDGKEAGGVMRRRKEYAETVITDEGGKTVKEGYTTSETLSAADGRASVAVTTGSVSFGDAPSIPMLGLRAAAMSPDGRSALIGVRAELSLWDARKGARLAKWKAPAEVDALAFSPDGRLAAVGLADGPGLMLLKFEQAKGRPVYGQSAKLVPFGSAAGAEEIDVDAPFASSVPADPDAFAVVIGVEKYRQQGIPSVEFAARDARAVSDYLTHEMGFDEKNVILLENEQATQTDLRKYLGTWLRNRVTPRSRVFVYYAGHGSPNPRTGEGYLMPYESDPAYTEDTALPVSQVLSTLGKLPAKRVTVVLDACFSGQGRRSVIAAGARPLVAASEPAASGKVVLLSAARGDETSTFLPDRRHGLLTYYLLKGLRGAAAKEGAVTTGSLFAYVRPQVERAARLQNVQQTPVLTPAPDALGARSGDVWARPGR